MHVLDDPYGLSPRAREFLRRAGLRRLQGTRSAEEHLRVSDRLKRPVVPPPDELIVRREWFASRFGGMHYEIRRRLRAGTWRRESVHRWQFELLSDAQEDHTGWSFEWRGECVSSPVSYRVHADGRFGVNAGGPFLEVSPSVYHLIEGHALMDELFGWEPMPLVSLEAWVPGEAANAHLRALVDALPAVQEASGPCDRWWRSDDLAIRVFREWTTVDPRPAGVMIWSRNGRLPESPRRHSQ
jgi:hypothetical protein